MRRFLFAIAAFAMLVGSASALDLRAQSSDEMSACTGSPKTGDPS
jgi:hypothetical protein